MEKERCDENGKKYHILSFDLYLCALSFEFEFHSNGIDGNAFI